MNYHLLAEHDEYGVLEMPAQLRARRKPYTAKTKQALYVSTKFIARLFTQSKFDPQVWITDQIDELIKAISQHGKISSRKPEGKYRGLENDPSRQQIILYTVVLDRALEHILFYRRADSTTVTPQLRKQMGDKRLRGMGSIGFGGHIEHVDQLQWKVLSMLIPGFYQQIRKTLSLEVARIREFEEELGITGADLNHFFLAKAFRQVYAKEQLAKADTIPVGAVHTCICAVAILDTEKLDAENRPLVFKRSEIATLEWIKVKDILDFIDKTTVQGERVEEWSQILKNFIPEILAEAKRVTRTKTN